MSLKKLAGGMVILVGIGCLGLWADRSFFHPAAADRQFWNNVADHGGPAAVLGKPPAAVLIVLGIGAIGVGQHLIQK